MRKISIIFPMAGLGSRFGYTFKPFLLATDETFIELAKKPFERLIHYGFTPEYYFIVRESQEKDFNVSQRLHELFPNDIIHCLTIGNTNGPLQTLQAAIQKYKLTGESFVCDCDHAICIDPLIQNFNLLKTYDVLIPTWNITTNEYLNWGKVKLSDTGEILDFCEKETIDGYLKGLIGCYLFYNINDLLNYSSSNENISDVLKCMLLQNKPLKIISITKAEFFGTPSALELYRFKRAQQYTLFIDIDGTLIHQTERTILPGAFDKINEWQACGHRIILTTARRDEHMTEIINILSNNYIYYDDIINNLPPGPRYVINDRKPYLPYYSMAQGIILDRNKGLLDITLHADTPRIVKILEGASFAQVYLVEDKKHKFIRKYISKSPELNMHVDILKRQCDDLKRLNFYKKDLCPTVLNEYESPSEYYYDMEYLDEFHKLSEFSSDIIYRVLPFILDDLDENVYCYRRRITHDKRYEWLENYMKEKILPKFPILTALDPIIHSFFEQKIIKLNDKHYKPIPEYLNKIMSYQKVFPELAPEFVCPIHGDLTLENILYHPKNGSYRLIDPSGSRYMDAIEMDTAKLFQSLICDYVSWMNKEDLVTVLSENEFIIDDMYLIDKYHMVKHIYSPIEYQKGLFYMSTYFIRMVPFMYHKSKQHALFVLLLATFHLDSINYNYKPL